MIKFVILILCFSNIAQTRVFDMNEARFAGYFNYNYGNSDVGKDYFEGESSATTFSKGFATHSGGEFGFIYSAGKIAWLFGLEIMKPPKTRGEASTGGTANYNYTSDVSVYVPKVGIELVFYQTTDFKIFASGSVGTGSLTSKSDYTNLTIAPNADFSVEGKGSANLMNYSVGGELHWTDNTTVLLAVGYRQLDFKKIKYLENVASSFTGAHSKGDQILKSDGSALKYDFTNTYLTLGFRFWIH